MRSTLRLVVMLAACAGFVSAQETQPAQETQGVPNPGVSNPGVQSQAIRPAGPRVSTRRTPVKKVQQVPSIIQSELDRSRAEEKQLGNVPVQPVQQPAAAAPLWPLFLSLGLGLLFTGGLLMYFFRRNNRPAKAVARTPYAAVHHNEPVVVQPRQVPADAPAISLQDRYAEAMAEAMAEDRAVTSTSPYVNEDDTEMPEAALTMNLLNKKRETKKEVILEVMKRVQRKEKPQHIAEALRIGIGEVHLAMTLAKLKK